MGDVRYYSTASAAKAIDYSRSFVHQMIVAGHLKAINVAAPGERIRYRIAEADLKAFIETPRPAKKKRNRRTPSAA